MHSVEITLGILNVVSWLQSVNTHLQCCSLPATWPQRGITDILRCVVLLSYDGGRLGVLKFQFTLISTCKLKWVYWDIIPSQVEEHTERKSKKNLF
jgi:hypothetical protein